MQFPLTKAGEKPQGPASTGPGRNDGDRAGTTPGGTGRDRPAKGWGSTGGPAGKKPKPGK